MIMANVGWVKLLTVTAMLMASVAVAEAQLLAISGKVVDLEGNPLAGVEIVATAEDSSRTYDDVTKKKGRFVLRVPSTESGYRLRARLEGYLDVELDVMPTPGSKTVVTITMEQVPEPTKDAAAAQESTAAEEPPPPQMSDKRMAAVAAYNDGVRAIQEGDHETAMAKFEEAAAVDPELSEALNALVGIAFENKDYDRAAKASEMLLILSPDDLRTLQISYVANYMIRNVEGLVSAARRLAEMDPAIVERDMIRNAKSSFEAGKVAICRALMEVAVEAQPVLAEAQLQLGMCCNAEGDASCAREAFGKFLELAPDHPEAEVARSLLEYLE
jgi:Tfp pilus assembly protein PilF